MAVKTVSKELALKLKKLGFDMPVIRAYKPKIDEYFVQRIEIDANRPIFKPLFSAPTYDEVLHWLRDKHGFHGEVRNYSISKQKLTYYPFLEIYNNEKWEDVLDTNEIDFYEYHKAQLAIINKAIEILEQQHKNKEHG